MSRSLFIELGGVRRLLLFALALAMASATLFGGFFSETAGAQVADPTTTGEIFVDIEQGACNPDGTRDVTFRPRLELQSDVLTDAELEALEDLAIIETTVVDSQGRTYTFQGEATLALPPGTTQVTATLLNADELGLQNGVADFNDTFVVTSCPGGAGGAGTGDGAAGEGADSASARQVCQQVLSNNAVSGDVSAGDITVGDCSLLLQAIFGDGNVLGDDNIVGGRDVAVGDVDLNGDGVVDGADVKLAGEIVAARDSGASAGGGRMTQLPKTGGVSLLILGGGLLLVGGGLLVRKISR